MLVDEAAPPGPLEAADPPPDPPLLEAAPPPLPDVLPELGAELGAGTTVVVLELDEDDLPGLLLLPGVMTVVSFFSSHPVNANAPRIANT